MIDNNIYSSELKEVLNENIPSFSTEHADLRYIYHEILNSIKFTSLTENNIVKPVKLTSTDNEFVTQKATDYLGNEKGNGLYSVDAIITALNDHLTLINDKIKSEVSFEIDALRLAGKQSSFEFLTIEEFRKRTK
ncbi:MAG: hypothetical protein A3D31_17555 [Candidatus Fluviicola riflensis]|nr:MAG: hypothetical protein CHH17_02495 [Candidatus Fluviicola riflensis]OGS76791.1 MAG: hypothetical protein A3D31_17555 [Candidatus Fluviicola riflensis]OGS82854.1 MAG: hypothetical protein A2724_13805 [Fluviicola sp. RIFCSPHIGHO2_01_FULL_43_53]OGS88521.1 MAG: hypothetical protein A3E30_07060 [Fluviicola sp. RIFCSPHIGHO2_12_FULL_43_24]